MPILQNMKTVWVTDKPWTSPDGKVTISMIKLEDPSGERGDWSTMSNALATMGWQGDVEVYENQKGKTYVRQAPKEDGYSGGSNAPADTSQGQSSSAPQAARAYDYRNLGATWGNALNAAVATVEVFESINSHDPDAKVSLEDIRGLVIETAKFYFNEAPADLDLPKGF